MSRIVLISVAAIFLFTEMNSCVKDDRIGLVVKTVDSAWNALPNVKIRVHCDTVINKGCIVEEVKYSDRFGNAFFNFELEALLIVEASTDSSYGKNWAELVEGENVSVTVQLFQ